jgi:hypothetical protein
MLSRCFSPPFHRCARPSHFSRLVERGRTVPSRLARTRPRSALASGEPRQGAHVLHLKSPSPAGRETNGRRARPRPAARSKSTVRQSAHFFRPPFDVSVFCPGGHLPVGFLSGLPRPGPSSIAAYETPLKANAIADARATMRFFMLSHPLSLHALRGARPRASTKTRYLGVTYG